MFYDNVLEGLVNWSVNGWTCICVYLNVCVCLRILTHLERIKNNFINIWLFYLHKKALAGCK